MLRLLLLSVALGSLWVAPLEALSVMRRERPWNWLVHQDEDLALRFEVPLGWPMHRPGPGRVQWSGPEETPHWYLTINLQGLPGKGLEEGAKALERAVVAGGGRVVDSRLMDLAGMAARSVLVHLERGGSGHLFRHLLVARPSGLAQLSFACPAALGERFASLVLHVEKTVAPLPVPRPVTDLPAAETREKELMAKAAATMGDPRWLGPLAQQRADMAERFLADGNRDRAVDYLSSACQAAPHRVDLLERLGEILETVPEAAALPLAQSYWADALERGPGNRSLRLRLAASLMSSGDFEEARLHFETLCRNAPFLPDDEFARPLAMLYLSQDQQEEGLAFMARMHQAGGGPPLRSLPGGLPRRPRPTGGRRGDGRRRPHRQEPARLGPDLGRIPPLGLACPEGR